MSVSPLAGNHTPAQSLNIRKEGPQGSHGAPVCLGTWFRKHTVQDNWLEKYLQPGIRHPAMLTAENKPLIWQVHRIDCAASIQDELIPIFSFGRLVCFSSASFLSPYQIYEEFGHAAYRAIRVAWLHQEGNVLFSMFELRLICNGTW